MTHSTFSLYIAYLGRAIITIPVFFDSIYGMVYKKDLSKFGIGTFGVGGMMERDDSLEDRGQVRALRYSIENGLNYLDTSFLYAEGHANEIIKKALRDFDRNKIFINAKLGDVKNISEVERQLDEYLSFFSFDYVDSFQIHSPSRIKSVGIKKVSEEIVRLVEKGKTRFFSVSNFGPNNLKQAMKVSDNKVFSLENDYSFDVRPCEDVGLLDFCNQNNVLFIPYRPLRRPGPGLVSNVDYPLVAEMAKKYKKTKNQILVNWYAWKDNVMPIIKSTSVDHIDENMEALRFMMDEADYKELDAFRVKNEKWNDIDWEYEGTGGTKISGLSFVFESN